MFLKDELVTYSASGVCTVNGTMENRVKGVKKQYLVLKPVFDANSLIYVPLDNEQLVGRIKRVMSREDIISLIKSLPGSEPEWIDDEIERGIYFKSVIKRGDRKELMQILRALYLHKQAQTESGRKFHSSDERFMKEAEHIVFEEFAVVLNISPEEVPEYISVSLDKASGEGA